MAASSSDNDATTSPENSELETYMAKDALRESRVAQKRQSEAIEQLVEIELPLALQAIHEAAETGVESFVYKPSDGICNATVAALEARKFEVLSLDDDEYQIGWSHADEEDE